METLESIITRKYAPTESVDNEMLLDESDPNLQSRHSGTLVPYGSLGHESSTPDSGTPSESVDEEMVKSLRSHACIPSFQDAISCFCFLFSSHDFPFLLVSDIAGIPF